MCRAVWVIVVGSSGEAVSRMRRGVGPEAQVVLVTTDATDPAIRTTQADALVVDGAASGSRELVADVAQAIAIVWVGSGAPGGVQVAVEPGDDLESALTKALLARRR